MKNTTQTLNQIKEIILKETCFDALEQISNILGEIRADFLYSHTEFSQLPANEQKVLKCYGLLVSWNVFSPGSILFAEWRDIAEMALQVMIEYIDSPIENYELLDSYERMMSLRDQRVRELEARPEYRDAFKELMGR